MYPLSKLPTLSRWGFWEWLWAVMVTVAVVAVLLAAADGVRADATANDVLTDADLAVGVMTAPMAEAVTDYRAELHAEWLEWFTHVNGPWSPQIAHTHPTAETRPPATTDTPPPADVESWRPLVAAYFPPDRVDQALKVIWCESRGDPSAKNPNSTASGLFQVLRGWWSGEWSTAIPAFDPFDPEANVAAAAKIAGGPRYWSDWLASKSCHGLS